MASKSLTLNCPPAACSVAAVSFLYCAWTEALLSTRSEIKATISLATSNFCGEVFTTLVGESPAKARPATPAIKRKQRSDFIGKTEWDWMFGHHPIFSNRIKG